MMYYYYDVNSVSLFETLFNGTYVYDNPTPNKNNYCVLKFDFSGIPTEKYREVKEYERIYNNIVISGLKLFNEHYNTNISIADVSLTASEILDNFIIDFNALKLEHKLYILIDEYDNFTNGILDGDASLFKNVLDNNGFVKSFYAVIKKYVGLGIVDRFFATGICPITLNSMTTGFNIATDISTSPEYNSMIGLTPEEVNGLFKELNLSEEEHNKIFNLMLAQYDGYRFNEDKEERVFNATLVMYFFSKYIENKEIPKRLYDNNIVVNYGKIDNILKLQGNTYYKEIISDILDNHKIIGRLKTQFNLVEDFSRNDIISLLYYFGYLTIDGTDDLDIVFKVPNQIMIDKLFC